MSDANKTTVQEKMARLNTMVEWFQSDEFSLEAAVEKFTQVETLAGEIEADLNGLKNEITIIKQRFDAE